MNLLRCVIVLQSGLFSTMLTTNSNQESFTRVFVSSSNRRPDRPELWKESSQQLVRRKELRERCSAEELNPLLDLSRLVYDDKHKVVMCVVPKVISIDITFLKWNIPKFEFDEFIEVKFHLMVCH